MVNKVLRKRFLRKTVQNNAFVYDKQSFRVGDNALLPLLEEATLILRNLSEWNIVFALCSVTDRDTARMRCDYVTNFTLSINISG